MPQILIKSEFNLILPHEIFKVRDEAVCCLLLGTHEFFFGSRIPKLRRYLLDTAVSVLDVAGVGEPHIIIFISQKLSLHLEDLFGSHFLHVEGYLVALPLGILDELPLL